MHFLRRLLMDTKVLPDRLDHLDRIIPWLDAQLDSRPATHARLLHPYAQWHLLRRARRRAQRRGESTDAANHLRKTIRAALELSGLA